jgi:arabinogalactan oligomer/maltooligosaccharide transport system substrate-binding protein
MKRSVRTVAALLAIAALPSFMFAAKKAKAKKVTLTVWESEGPEKDFMLWAAKEFPKSDPQWAKVVVKYEPVGATDARAKIELDGPAGVGADVFVAPHDHIGALYNGAHVLENDDPNFKNEFIPAAITGATYKGKVYGYPLGIETYALFYNKDLIKEAPKTWDEVVSFAKKFNDKSQNKYAIVWEVANAYYDYLFMGGFGAPLFGPNGNDRAQHNINSANAVKGLQYFQSLRKQILDVPSADMSGDFCNSSFTEGKAAMIITGPWKVSDYNKLGLNYGIAPIPVFPGQKDPPTSFSGIRLAFVSAYSNNPDAAKAFARFICSKAALQKRFELTRQIPPRKDITVNDPLSNGILAQAKYAVPMPTIPQMGTYWSAMGAAFAGIWDGDDVTTALNSAASAMESAK